MGDEPQLVQRLANNLWFRQTEYARNERGDVVRRNAISTEEDLKAMALRTIASHQPVVVYVTSTVRIGAGCL